MRSNYSESICKLQKSIVTIHKLLHHIKFIQFFSNTCVKNCTIKETDHVHLIVPWDIVESTKFYSFGEAFPSLESSLHNQMASVLSLSQSNFLSSLSFSIISNSHNSFPIHVWKNHTVESFQLRSNSHLERLTKFFLLFQEMLWNSTILFFQEGFSLTWVFLTYSMSFCSGGRQERLTPLAPLLLASDLALSLSIFFLFNWGWIHISRDWPYSFFKSKCPKNHF